VLLASLDAQERRPDELLLVDDGSTDTSPEIAERFACDRNWVRVARRPPREPGRDRLAGGAAVRAFEWGVERLAAPWDVVAKVDADLDLTPRTLATLMGAFAADPELGMAGPYIAAETEDGRVVRQRCPADHVEGESKLYRRACFGDIAPLPPMLGWDTIDEIRARLRGWRTASFEIPDGDPVHLRKMGSHDGQLRGYRRWGACAWGYGEHPLHVVAVGVQRIGDRPRVLGGASYVIGYGLAALRQLPRAEPEVRAQARRENLRKLRARFLGRRRPAVGSGA
jgi:glycosyltransferase involved in cell wall biosynthesis